jgi:mannose-1-phosphate guanylyltransferase
MRIVPIILSGGSGSRLWPLGMGDTAKPFLELAGTTAEPKSLYRATLERAIELARTGSGRAAPAEGGRGAGTPLVITVTRRDLLPQTVAECEKSAGFARSHLHEILLEPEGRDTAAALAAGVVHVLERFGPEAVAVLMPADHLIEAPREFQSCLLAAAELAASHDAVLLGCKPGRASTAYGYIEHDGQRVLRFAEKPDAQAAQSCVRSGRHLWNCGLVCARAGRLAGLFQENAPEVLREAASCVSNATVQTYPAANGSRTVQWIDARRWSTVPHGSFDRLVLEHVSDLAVIEADFGWSDAGSWDEMPMHREQAANRNGSVYLHDCEDVSVFAERPVAVLGVSNLIVAEGPGGLLVAGRGHAQAVRLAARHFASARADEPAASTSFPGEAGQSETRPWGRFTILDSAEGYKVKRLEVVPGGMLSLQSHECRSENWVVVSGEAEVRLEGSTTVLQAGGSIAIPAGARHRLVNNAGAPLVVIETQRGSYLGEDDEIRHEDAYGRSSPKPRGTRSVSRPAARPKPGAPAPLPDVAHQRTGDANSSAANSALMPAKG